MPAPVAPCGAALIAATAVLFVAGCVWGVSVLSSRWHQGYAQFYDRYFGTQVYSQLERMDPREVRLAVLDFRVYPFFGSARQFSVWNPLRVPSYDWLMKNLRDRRITHVFVRPAGHASGDAMNRYRHVEEWLLQHPDVFVPVKSQDRILFFTVNLTSPGPPGEEEEDRP